MLYRLFFFSLYFLFANFLNAQCCSQGSPINGTTNVGTVDKNNVRIILAHRYNYGNTYYDHTNKTDFKIAEESNFNYTSTIISYGLMKKLTLEAEVGYFFNKTLKYSFSTKTNYGFNNVVGTIKYALYKNTEKRIEITPAIGVKLPVETERRVINNVTYPYDIQTSTLAYGVVSQLFFLKRFSNNKTSLVLYNRNENNFDCIAEEYRYGSTYSLSSFVSHLFTPRIILTLQTRADYKEADFQFEKNVKNTGGFVGSVSPQVSYEIAPKFFFYSLIDIPIYRNFNGRQLSSKYSFSVSLIKNFCL
ncbi:MAG: hypothetical protein HUU48_03380 [Flavobacteriales bacterium]|nr:hypothetical protein [Flavobacteriales bacterium]